MVLLLLETSWFQLPGLKTTSVPVIQSSRNLAASSLQQSKTFLRLMWLLGTETMYLTRYIIHL